MKDVVEACVDIIKHLTGYEISRAYLPYVIVLLTVGPLCAWLYLLIRRWRGDFRAISGEMENAVRWISHDTRNEINGLLNQFRSLHDDLKGTVVERLDALQTLLKSTEEVADRAADDAIAADPSSTEPSRKTRLWLAEQVRNSVVSKWLDGRFLVQKQSNCFQYIGRTEAGVEINLIFQTPYRESLGQDGRLPFTLEAWVDGYKHLNFEWDSEGKYALRGFKRGEWIEDVARWTFVTGQAQKVAA